MSDRTAGSLSPGPLGRCHYRAFISYSHADEAWAKWLHKALETWRVPSRLVDTRTAAGVIPRRLAPVFRDRDELASAADLGERVNAALADSASLIVICSPRSAASRWVNEEVLACKRLGHAERIFCLIVDGEPNASDIAGRERNECFCPALRFALDADGHLSQQRAEPLAADAREGKDGKRQAKLKLIAGMLGVDFDTLRQRAQQQRMRRMAAITVLAVVAMLVTSALAITAVIARQQADTARQSAERRQKQAEDLVGFMLGDLNDKLQGVGRLDIMQAVDDKAMAYFQSLPTADVTDAALAGRATAMQKIGSVRMDQGHTAEALEAYRAAKRIEAERRRRAPGNVERESAYAQSLIWVGNAYWYQGKLERAGQQYRRAADTLLMAAKTRPGDSDLAYKLASTQNNYGHVLEARGNIQGAQAQYRLVMQAFAALHKQYPDDTRWQEQLGYAHNTLGKIALQQGDLQQAVAGYRDDWQFKTDLARQEPNNQRWRNELAASDAILAGALAMIGETARAATHARAAVESGQTLVSLDPANAATQDYLALYRIRLAGLLRQQGEPGVAVAQIDSAMKTLRSLTSKDATNPAWARDLAKAQLESAKIAQARGRPDDARHSASAALARLQALLSTHPDSRTSILLATRTGCLLGDLDVAEHDTAAAQAHWRKARDLVAPLSHDSSDPELLAAWSGTMLRLGERKTTEAVVAKLQQMGYRDPDFIALLKHHGIAYPPNPGFQKRISQLMQ